MTIRQTARKVIAITARGPRTPILATLGALALGACTPTVPDSGAGVGFQDYNSYIRNSYAQPAQPSAPAPVAAAAPSAPSGGFSTAAASAALDRASGTASPGAISTGNATLGNTVNDAPMGAIPMGGTNSRISDENDFNAVAARESISSDADRIARNRQQYVVDQPGALPTRPEDSGPNIVQFALSTSHSPGQQMYKRSARAQRKDATIPCAQYASADLAQQAFLAQGGPDKDKLGLDPDGDGFACGWNPNAFRNALR